MQSFRMYEFVLVGTPTQARAHRDAWLDRGLQALAALGLPVRRETATTRSSAGWAGCWPPTRSPRS